MTSNGGPIEQGAPPPGENGPEKPRDLGARAWWGTLRRTVGAFRANDVTDWAAALTYYSVLSIFPALIALVATLGLIGEPATQPLLDHLANLAPGPANDIFSSAIREITASQSSAGAALLVGVVVALWSASAYVGAFGRASNAIYEVEEGRPFWKLRPQQVAITAFLILLLVGTALAVVLTGPLAQQVGDVVGVGDGAQTIWGIVKWPLIALVVVTMFATLYWATPNVRHAGFRWITPGGLLALAVWIVASVGFTEFVANFGSYNATYGSLAGVAVFLIWLWLSNVALLLGVQLNAELERSREIAAGIPEEETLAVPVKEEARSGDPADDADAPAATEAAPRG